MNPLLYFYFFVVLSITLFVMVHMREFTVLRIITGIALNTLLFAEPVLTFEYKYTVTDYSAFVIILFVVGFLYLCFKKHTTQER